ncbi:MAG TPA: hypothetical protein VL283_05700 [Candidatus Baltobacteraceae bacterium]|jgi:hypothetical protein|nr:hypothetical protein [Candidatus Baltobacteraceae bacterium]
MPETKPAFIHTFRFNCWLIVMFFQMLTGLATIGGVAVIHALGNAAGEELSRYDTPAPKRTKAPKPVPPRPAYEGTPVAYQAAGTGR